MKIKWLGGALAMLAGTVLQSGCGGESTQAMAMPLPMPQALDTMQVLKLARASSESSDPLPVAEGALLLADSEDETSDPLPAS